MAQPVRTLCREFTSFEAVAEFFANWQGTLEQLSSGRFQGRVRIAEGRLLRVATTEFNQVLLARGEAAPGQVGIYPVTPRTVTARWQGRALQAGHWVAHGPSGETNHRSARGCEMLGITLAEHQLSFSARILLGGDALPTTSAWSVLQLAPAHTGRLQLLAKRLLRLDEASLASAEGGQLEEACLRVLVEALAQLQGKRPRPVPLPARAAVVQQANELMRGHLHAPLGALDLCAAVGVSDRTLRLAFRERFGVGPMVYFRYLRLNAVRMALRGSDQPIAAVARQFGFHHLGHFAADYRRLFGELPSAAGRGL